MLVLAFCLGLPVTASANGLEPPYLTILVTHPPKDLELTLVLEDDASQEPFVLQPEPMLWESYYRFYPHIWSPWAPEGTPLQTATLFVKTGGESFSLAVEPKGFTYSNNLVTLDVAGRQLLYGQPWWRIPLLVFLRVALTLLLEGALFWLFGYRQRRSWLVFLLANLITQGAVNVCVHLLVPVATSAYNTLVLGMFLYTPLEIGVLLVEMLAFALLLKEHRKRRAVCCAALANLLSWALGGTLLFLLPI